MQAIFFFGMMGVFFYIVTAVTTGLFQNATQIKQQRIERTKEIMREVEFALNDGVLQEQASLQGIDVSNLLFARQYVSATPDELTKDPWGTDYQITSFSEDVILLADGSGSMGPSAAIANVRTFGVMSAGPDLVFDTPTPGNVTELKFMSPQGDDVIRVFSDYDAMNRIWNRAYSIDDTIEDVAIKTYTDLLRNFVGSSETVVYNGRTMTRADVLAEYSMCLAAFNLSNSSYNGNVRRPDNTLIDCAGAYSAANVASCAERVDGQIIISPETASCWMSDPNMLTVDGYPNMAGNTDLATVPTVSSLDPASLGVEHEVRRDPFGGNVVLEFNKDNPHVLVLRRNYQDDDWNINYYREIVGVDPTAL
jgi:hypothetical protein